jgi:hypothetical protein
MISRSTLIAALVVVELAIIGEMFVAFRGDQPPAWPMQGTEAEAASGPNLIEGGAHMIFDGGAHPALTVNIGYADLTVLTGSSSQIDVSVSKSTDFGPFRSKAPITARKEGDTTLVMTTPGEGWTMGDNRMVTVVVPPATHVTIVKAGDIDVTGLRGEASIKAVGMGSISVEDYDGPALRVEASNGRISLNRIIAARIDVVSSDGRIEGTALQVRDGSIESSDGRVTLGFAPGTDTLVTAEVSDGKIRLSGLESASPAETHKSSDDDDDDSTTQSVRIGAGTGRLDVRSSDGNIELRQEG